MNRLISTLLVNSIVYGTSQAQRQVESMKFARLRLVPGLAWPTFDTLGHPHSLNANLKEDRANAILAIVRSAT